MPKFIIFAIILTIMYIVYASLMKAAGKTPPLMPNVKYDEEKSN
ncbi:MAG: hypothetical protein ACREV6_08580 [Clostridium sp.]